MKNLNYKNIIIVCLFIMAFIFLIASIIAQTSEGSSEISQVDTNLSNLTIDNQRWVKGQTNNLTIYVYDINRNRIDVDSIEIKTNVDSEIETSRISMGKYISKIKIKGEYDEITVIIEAKQGLKTIKGTKKIELKNLNFIDRILNLRKNIENAPELIGITVGIIFILMIILLIKRK